MSQKELDEVKSLAGLGATLCRNEQCDESNVLCSEAIWESVL